MNTPARRRVRGLTIVELLVALVVALVLTLAMAAVLINSGTLRRTTTSIDELSLSTSVLAYQLDRQLRGAGSGFSQRWPESYGCELHAQRDGNQLLPVAATAFPAPFDGMPVRLRLAPVLVGRGLAGAGGDVLVTMAGTGGFGETGARVLAGGLAPASVRLPTALGIRPDDLLLLVDPATQRCMVQGVAAGFLPTSGQTVALGGPYAATTIAGLRIDDLNASGRALAMQLGTDGPNAPQFSMIAVDASRNLMRLDLLRTAPANANAPVAFYENVVRLRALYGVTDPGNAAGTVDRWVDPVATDPQWSIDALNAGTPNAAALLRRIVAVRLAFVVRATALERDAVSPAQLVLFPDLPPSLHDTVALSDEERRQRHRVVDITVPLRTVQLQPL